MVQVVPILAPVCGGRALTCLSHFELSMCVYKQQHPPLKTTLSAYLTTDRSASRLRKAVQEGVHVQGLTLNTKCLVVMPVEVSVGL
jgi:hypothetical protein